MTRPGAPTLVSKLVAALLLVALARGLAVPFLAPGAARGARPVLARAGEHGVAGTSPARMVLQRRANASQKA